LKAATEKFTPLAEALANPSDSRVTPIDVFHLARKRWLEGRSIRLCELAEELGISRGKLYHWVGNKEMLIDEIIWSLLKPLFHQAVTEAPGAGIDHVVAAHKRFISEIYSFGPLKDALAKDPGNALGFFMRHTKNTRQRTIEATADHLREQVARGHLKLDGPVDGFAEVIIKISEGILYNDILQNHHPASIDLACGIIKVLLTYGKVPDCNSICPDD